MNQSLNHCNIYLDYFLDTEGDIEPVSETSYKDTKSSIKNIENNKNHPINGSKNTINNPNIGAENNVSITNKKIIDVKSDNKIINNDTKTASKNTNLHNNIKNDISSITNLDDLLSYTMNMDHPLKYTANKIVFGDGNRNSKIILIGEAPGADEDLHGIPFCGKSGTLLMNAIKAIGIDRSINCYITNTVFWRPPANRKPTQDEMAMCLPILEKKINIIKPELIILVGSSASESILKTNKNITSLRKNFTNIEIGQHKTTTVAIYHPSYILRSPNVKSDYWFDLIEIEMFLKGKNIETNI